MCRVPVEEGGTRGKGSVGAAPRIFSCQQRRARRVPPGAGHRGILWLLTGRMEVAIISSNPSCDTASPGGAVQRSPCSGGRIGSFDLPRVSEVTDNGDTEE